MRPYLCILGARFRVQLQYRAAALAGTLTQLFWGLIRVMIFDGFYRSSTAVHPISLAQVVSYVWLSQAAFGMLPDRVEPELRDMIRTGNVTSELLRPIDLYWSWFCRCLAMTLIPTLMRSGPLLAVAFAFLELQTPPGAASVLAAAAAFAGGMLVSSAITALLSIGLFWTVSGDGLTRLSVAAAYLFSGMVLPIPLLPEALQKAAALLPYRYVLDVPMRLYLGHIPASEAPMHLAAQLAWLLVLVAAGRSVLSRGLGRLVVQGG
ncbi:MAG: ABC-2 family transporter protein [Candidatus Wallbacteria bacterium]|nr:ABC-2 family transporter protein [Candidatus Wallbacteria bacterium]